MATVLESFVSDYLLQKLVAFAEEKVALISGVKDELKTLEGRMRGIGAFLKDAERRRITDESVNNWLNELKDVIYDADDMIDLWRYNNQLLPTEEPTSSSNSPTCCPFLSLSCFRSIPVRHEIAVQVKNLNLKLDQIIRDKSNLNLQQLQSEVREVSGRDARVSSPVITVDVVGNEIEEGTKKLVKMATVENIKKFNLAITGMGGIGKTTTAQRIYNNHAIENRYDMKMWLSITKSYSSAQIVKEAIRQAKGNPGQAERESELLPILASAMSGKSFFLVLDDVWNPDVWVKLLQDPLMANTTQGFILVTTRDQSIALQMGAKHIHQATILSTKSGWELLRKRAYITDAEDIRTLEDVGIEIVKKCGGIPLAIKSMAAMLANKDATKNEWEKYSEKQSVVYKWTPK